MHRLQSRRLSGISLNNISRTPHTHSRTPQADSGNKMLQVCLTTVPANLTLPQLSNMLVAIARQATLSTGAASSASQESKWLHAAADAVHAQIVSSCYEQRGLIRVCITFLLF